METSNRTSLNITYSVWRALFLREMVDRLFKSRAAWVWLFFDPVMHIALLMLVFAVIRQRAVAGMETPLWIMTGLLAYFAFNRSLRQSMGAVNANRQLFAYRQVKPVDTVIVRALLEIFLLSMVAIILFTGAALFGVDVVPDNPLLALAAFFGLWLAGLGAGLVLSVPVTLSSDVGRVIDLALTPLYMTSGVIVPITMIPNPYREWLLLNPILHGVEGVRQGFSEYYHAVPELDLAYLYQWGIGLILFGLALQLRFALRLSTK